MAFDVTNHRLFLGADRLMVMMDSISGKVVTTVPIGSGVDANSFDPGTKLARPKVVPDSLRILVYGTEP
jgi:hypothetical protein